MAAVVVVMIALTVFLIHLLNRRHRHQHLRAVHYDHGLAGFGGFGGPGAGTGRVVPPVETVQPTQSLRKGEPRAADRPSESGSGSGE
ncbi:hypothetical protein [Streptomyces sp. NBC_00154]|uniref:hypothetical protein n=1 Tax=Streptomyces sp. NBC_00154 TaxID=2975670 RepID=UPI00224D58FB|nr:hypothetical protein [Streptomyces sp. NBC_00154]MCX5312326.1 hypothetical protein [Streptomyces sp. NBC_00154]